jgi:hypothetical protein
MAVHVLRKIQEMIASGVVKELSVEVHADVVSYLLNNKMEFISNLQVDNKVKVNFSGKSHLEFSDFQYRVVERYKNDDSEVVPKGKSKTQKLVEEVVRPKKAEKVTRQKPAQEEVAKKQVAEAPPQKQKKAVPVRTDATVPDKAVETEIEAIPAVDGEDPDNKAEKGRSSRNRFQRRPQRRPRQVHGRRRRYSRRYDLYAKLPSISKFSNILKKNLKQKAKPKITQSGARAQLPAGVRPALKHQVHRMPQAPAKPSFKVQGPPNVTAKPPYK